MIALPAAQQLKKEFASNRINIFAALTIFLKPKLERTPIWRQWGWNLAPPTICIRFKNYQSDLLHPSTNLSILFFATMGRSETILKFLLVSPFKDISFFAKEHLFALINMLYRNEGIITTLPIWCAHWRPLASFLQWLVHSFWWLDWFIKLFSWDRFESENGRFLRRFYGRWCRKLINT